MKKVNKMRYNEIQKKNTSNIKHAKRNEKHEKKRRMEKVKKWYINK